MGNQRPRGRRETAPNIRGRRSRFSSFGLALDVRLSLGLGGRATPEPAGHSDCRHADHTAPQPSGIGGRRIRFEQFAIGVRRRRGDDRSRAGPSFRSGNPTADVAERLRCAYRARLFVVNLVAIEAKAGNTQLHGASVPRVHDASAFGVVGSSITSYATRSARTVSIGQIRIADPPPQYETRRSIAIST